MFFSFETLEKIAFSKKPILLLTKENPTFDMIASLLAIAKILEKMGGQSIIFLPNKIPSQLNFLGENFYFIDKISYARDFVLIFNTEKNKITNIQTEHRAQKCFIRITPEKGTINPRDFSFMPADFSYSWLGLIGVSSLKEIGTPYLENPDLFFEIPKLNIDNQSENETYGQANWINKTASSIGEILADFFLEKKPEFIDQEIAKILLTAIIAGTESFQKANTNPNSMILSARLMKYGIKQTEIIRHLYRDKNLNFLKLWGKIMSNLRWEETSLFAHSWISQEDFLYNQATRKDLQSILEEIQKNFSSAEICAVFLVNEKNEIEGDFAFSCLKKAEKICNLFHKPLQERISINFGLKEMFFEKNILEKIKKTLSE